MADEERIDDRQVGAGDSAMDLGQVVEKVDASFIEDLCTLPELSEETLNTSLKSRHEAHHVYVSINLTVNQK